MRKVIQTVFFGNYFYGLCAVGLAIEASLQQGIAIPSFGFFVFIFLTTVWFYTEAYRTQTPPRESNTRHAWYFNNRKNITVSQWIYIAAAVVLSVLFAVQHWDTLLHLSLLHYALIGVFPLAGMFYYGMVNIRLRDIGWLKPFVIGFAWAGLVTVYPLLYDQVVSQDFTFNFIYLLLFVKNFMFVSVLCIMFDIKDYAADANHELKTFVVKNGLRRTIFYILIPLLIIGWGTFMTYGLTNYFSPMKIVLNTVPFVATIFLAYQLHHRRNIFFYLGLIDGIMLLKALCGTVAMVWF